MTPAVQTVLARAADYVRQQRLRQSEDLEVEYAYATGVVAGLHDAGLISHEEHGDWVRRIEAAAHPEWSDEAHHAAVSNKAARPVGLPAPVRVLTGATEPQPFLDGWVRIPLVEVGSDAIRVWWRIEPLPSAPALFGDDWRLIERDFPAVDIDVPDAASDVFHSYLSRVHALAQLGATDDQSTAYRATGGGSSGGDNELSGYTRLSPALPVSARQLTLTIGTASFRFEL